MEFLKAALDELSGDSELCGADGVCPAAFERGNDRIVLITGDNAGGKTLLGTVLGALARRESEDTVEVMNVGMRLRTEGGMARAFVFGSEEYESTGQISIRSVLGGMSTCRKRTTPHLLVLDEPDVGLSEGYQAAVGAALAEFAGNLPELTEGLVVVTHSRPLARHVMALAPTCIRVGDDLRPTAEWMEKGPLPKSVEDLEGLMDRALHRFRAVTALRESRQAARRAEKSGPGR